MNAFKVICPHCKAALRCSLAPRVGKQVECPMCADLFTIRPEHVFPATNSDKSGVYLNALLAGEAAPIQPAAPPPTAFKPALGIVEPPRKKVRPTPAPRPARKLIARESPRRSSTSARLWIGLGVAGFFLLIASGALGYLALRGKDAGARTGDTTDPILLADSKPALPKEKKEPDPPERKPEPAKKPVEVKEVAPAKIIEKKPVEDTRKPETLDLTKLDPKTVDARPVAPKPAEPEKDKVPAFIAVGPVTPGLPGVEMEKVDRAVLRGAGYLKSQQFPTGSWSKGGHLVGHAALGGLTLLECKFPAKDVSIQGAARFVRMNSAKLDETYDLSLAVLFLDRLGDSRDKPLIQGLSLRLVAGQTEKGGWDYHCPLLTPQDMHQMITYLQKTQQKVALQLPRKDDPYQPPNDLQTFQPFDQGGKGGKQPGDQPITPLDQKGKEGQPGSPYQKPGQTPSQPGDQPALGGAQDRSGKPVAKPPSAPGAGEPKVKGIAPAADVPITKKEAVEPLPPKAPVGVKPRILPKGAGKTPPAPARPPEFFPPPMRGVPPFVAKGKGKGAFRMGRDDNSNSQFALLALWAARRHGVPTESTLQRAGERYRKSQNLDGGWGYQIGKGTTGPMSCVGVLGLAMGIGTAPEFPRVKAGKAPAPGIAAKPVLDAADVDAGLLRVASFVGEPSLTGYDGLTANLYFLWSVERVSMMYGLRTIGGKDWYGWGAQMLVKNQNRDGSWTGSRYPGSTNTVDTCLALLILKRSNLADDLTRNFEHFLVIRDPGAK